MSMHPLRRRGALALSFTLMAASTPALAQRDVRPVRPGETVRAVLSAADPAFSDGRRFRVYRLDARAGSTYQISLRSTAFDPLLQVLRATGPVSEEVARDDDGGGARNSLLLFRPPAAGRYLLVATAYAGDSAAAVGEFQLEVREAAEHALLPRALPQGQTVRGELGDASARTAEGVPHDVYTFTARAGERVEAVLVADSALDASFAFGRMTDGQFQTPTPAELHTLSLGPLAAAPGEPVQVTIPADGEYALQVRAGNAGRRGAYTIRFDSAGEAPPPGPVRSSALARPGEVADTLTSRDAVRETMRLREYVYAAAAGERVTLTLASSDFDAYLEAGYVQGGAFTRVAWNDDSRGTDARVSFVAPEARAYVVRAMSLGADTGAYTLKLESRPQVARTPPQVGRIRAGQQATGSLAAEDAALELDGSPYDDWIYHATRAGERIVVTVSSGEFDTYVMLAPRRADGIFEEFASNDDAQPQTDPAARGDSRLVVVLPAAGDYVIRVNTFYPERMGAYTLRVDPAPAAAPVAAAVP